MSKYWDAVGQTPAEVMAAVRRDGLQGERLMRALAGVDGWSSPTGAGMMPLIRHTDSGRRLALFSDTAVQQVHCATHGLASELFVSMPGRAAFAFSDVDGIDVDPGDRGALGFENEELAALQQIAEATAIEAFLHGAKDIDRPFARMRTYTGYRVLAKDGQWMLAPDSRGRALIAVCTSPATEAALRERIKQEPGQPTTSIVLNGAELFGRLQHLSKAQGIVFNPSGPVPPRAMALQIAEMVLTRDG